MTKIISLIRTLDMSGEDFRRYWREEFLPSLTAIPAVRDRLAKVVHNHVLPSAMRDDLDAGIGQWSGVSEMWFFDQPSAEAFLASDEVKAAIAAHRHVIADVVHVHVREILGWDRGSDQVAAKAIALFAPREGLSRADTQAYWNYQHLNICAALGMSQKLSKYVQNHVLPDFRNAPGQPDFVGGPWMWFETAADAQSVFSDEALLAELKIDEAKFADGESAIMLLVEEEDVLVRR